MFSGTYNPLQLMGPTTIAVWAGAGNSGVKSIGADDHVIVLESLGPARISGKSHRHSGFV